MQRLSGKLQIIGNVESVSTVMAKCPGVGELTILTHLRKPAYHLKPTAIACYVMKRI